MSYRKTLIVITIITVLAATACCVNSCRKSRSDKLRFIGDNQQTLQRSQPLSLVVAVHGWLEKGGGDWPEDMAVAIDRKLNSDHWLCGYFDWARGSASLNPTDAAKYAADIAGPALAEDILALDADLRHIHLIGHSSGCWAISTAAKILAEKTTADIHLTFFDAYVPLNWPQDSLGDVNMSNGAKYWADHYYTRDYTLSWTEYDLTFAHNVDVSDVDQGIKDHNFPWQWYHATITGKYPTGHFLDNRKFSADSGSTAYGFARAKGSLDDSNWHKTLQLPIGNKAVIIENK